MADAVIRLGDVIVPEVYTSYLVEQSIHKNAFMQSGIMATHPTIQAAIAAGGETFNIPFWGDITGDPQALKSGTAIDTAKTTTAKMVARRLLYGRGWAHEELAAAMSGENPMAAIQGMVDNYWNRFINKVIFYSIKGVITDNIANDSGSLVKDITTTGTPGATNKISASALIDTAAKMGDQLDKFVGIAVNSAVYATMLKNDAIVYVKDSTGTLSIPTFMGLRVIVDDGLAYDTDGSNKEYWSILFRAGAIGYGESANRITPVEVDRDAAKSEDKLYTRRQFAVLPLGFKWLESSVNDDIPTLDEIQSGGNWDRVYQVKNCGFTVLISNG